MNDATRPCGSLSMKPTVSETSTRGRVSGTQRPHGGVERREQLVGDVDLAAGERAHQRRLAGVGVADQRDPAHVAAARALGALLLRQRRRARAVSSAMRSRILRRSSSRLDSPAPLPPMPPRWRSLPLPGLAQARRQVLQAHDLDLRLGGARAGVAVEDLEDHGGAVQHLDAGRLLEVARLRRGDLVIDQHRVDRRGQASPPSSPSARRACRCRAPRRGGATGAAGSPWR